MEANLLYLFCSHTAYVRSAAKVFLNSSIIAQVICQMLYSFSQLIVHFFYIFRLKVQIDVKWGRWKLLYQSGWGAQIRTLPLPYILPLVVLLNINSIGSKWDCFLNGAYFQCFVKNEAYFRTNLGPILGPIFIFLVGAYSKIPEWPPCIWMGSIHMIYIYKFQQSAVLPL